MSTVADFFGAGSGGGDQVAAPRSEGGRGGQTGDIVIPIARLAASSLVPPVEPLIRSLPPSCQNPHSE